MPWRVKTRNAMEEESKVALTRSRGNNRSEKYNFFQSQGFSFKKWEVRPFIFQGKSTEALRGHRCSRLIRVCFFRKSEFVFFSKIGVCFLKIGVCFLKIGVCFFDRSLAFSKVGGRFFWKSEFVFWKSEFIFLKIGVWFLEIGVCLFWKLEFVLKKIGVCSFQNRSLFFENPSIGPRFCAVILLWSSNKISGRSMEGAGESGPPLSLDQTEAQKHFLETAPLLISGSGWPPPPSPYLKVFIQVFR